ncbi:MAG TPA: NAD(P)/FAD-dependent oxidoreductase [Candidatus Angelobacter sp.]|nr:NAD(P)/FAD-dependent oxidoreductase [Candidatus Angelobacter sp.]
MQSFDVIVIGGSVSGAPTAMLLAKRGYKVLVVERQTFPRDTLSTHFIWPRGVSYLSRWGLAQQVFDQTPNFRRMEVNIEGIGLVGAIPLRDVQDRFIQLHGDCERVTDVYCGPRRFFLDQLLLDAARAAGADVRESTTCNYPFIEAGVVRGVQITGPTRKPETVRARLVIGADGRFSSFVKQVGAKTLDLRPLSTFAYWGYYSGIDRAELAIHKRGRVGTAIFPTSHGTHMVLVYGPSAWWDDFRKDAEANFFKTYEFCSPEITELVRAGKREEPFKACGTMPAFQRELYGPGWALVGDAGSFKDQVTAMGITHSFRDAELITGFIHRALSGEVPMENAMAEYCRVRDADYHEYFDLVCHTAEMNAYSRAEVEFFYSIRNNQKQIDQLISQFGDTLLLSKGERAESPVERLPEFITQFDSRIPGYLVNPYKAGQFDSSKQAVAV